jgi:hypothetical protein
MIRVRLCDLMDMYILFNGWNNVVGWLGVYTDGYLLAFFLLLRTSTEAVYVHLLYMDMY